MLIFVTGATGFVGSAVVADLIARGHSVLGMTRSEKGAAALEAAGARVHHGTLEDLESLRRGAAAADAVIHTAFNHDFSKFLQNCELDARAIAALGDGLKGSKRPLLVTSGVAHLAPGRLATEDDPAPVNSPTYPRKSESAAAALCEKGINAGVVRLPPSVHGRGDHGFVPILVGIARDKGASAYVGTGDNRWPAVHRLDAARVYTLAIERGVSGARYHAVAEEGVPFKEIAAVIGRGLNVPVVGYAKEKAADHFGWFTMFAGIDAATSGAKTRTLLDWKPKEVGLLADIAQAGYFK